MLRDAREQALRRKVLEAARRHCAHAHGTPVPFRPGQRVPYGGRVFDEREVVSLVDAALDFWLTAGPHALEFEKALARYVGVRHCSFVNSGSSANLLAFMALTSPSLGRRRIARGDEVITVAAGFPTTVAPIVQYGAVPVFVDVALPAYNVDCRLLESALSPRTRAVVLAHTLGNPFDVAAVLAFCRRHGLWLIEDNCDALGARFRLGERWRRTGGFGHLSTFSFYPPHHLTTGEGGAVCTDDPRLRRLVESFRDWGRDCWCPPGKDDSCRRRFSRAYGRLPRGYDHKYVYSHFGYNLKATDLQAAIGRAQLEKLPAFVRARNENWRFLREGLADLEDRLLLPEPTPGSEPSWFGFPITVRERSGLTRAALVERLEADGIQTRTLFAGNLVRHPCFDELRAARRGFRVVGRLAATDRVLRGTFWVGVYPGLSEAMRGHLLARLRAAAGAGGRAPARRRGRAGGAA